MEEVLDRQTVNRGCVLTKNPLGLYDLQINDEAGRVIVAERNISYLRAVSVIEENMNQAGRGER